MRFLLSSTDVFRGNDRTFDSSSEHMTYQYDPQKPAPPPILPSPPFWKSGGGIALIVVLGLIAIPALCILGCLGMGFIGAVAPGTTPTP